MNTHLIVCGKGTSCWIFKVIRVDFQDIEQSQNLDDFCLSLCRSYVVYEGWQPSGVSLVLFLVWCVEYSFLFEWVLITAWQCECVSFSIRVDWFHKTLFMCSDDGCYWEYIWNDFLLILYADSCTGDKMYHDSCTFPCVHAFIHGYSKHTYD